MPVPGNLREQSKADAGGEISQRRRRGVIAADALRLITRSCCSRRLSQLSGLTGAFAGPEDFGKLAKLALPVWLPSLGLV